MAKETGRQRANITSARSGASRELAGREKRYAITMAFRTACFIGLFFVPGVWRWVLLAGAVFLPYIAVIFANQADKGSVSDYAGPSITPDPLPQVTTGEYETVTVDLDDIEEPDPWPRERSDGDDRAA